MLYSLRNLSSANALFLSEISWLETKKIFVYCRPSMMVFEIFATSDFIFDSQSAFALIAKAQRSEPALSPYP